MPGLRYQYSKVVPVPDVVAASEENASPIITIGTTLAKVSSNINTIQSDLLTITPVLVKVRTAIQASLPSVSNDVWVNTWIDTWEEVFV